MLFNSLIFLFLFLPVTYLVFWMLRSARTRYAWLAITGYIFYGYWDARFCLLMAFSTLVSYAAGRGLLAYTSSRARKLCLIVPVTVDLCLLGFFKYANFFSRMINDLSLTFGSTTPLPYLAIVLPVGISFYTFHTITYIVDAYRGVIKPTKNIFEYAAYVSLFSQLVAGPIVRFRQIEEDLESLGTADRKKWLYKGIGFFVFGMMEKVIIADSLASIVNVNLSHYETLSTLGAWLAMLGYSFQIYFDFSGYSSMAVGLGFMFGLRIPQNFNSPYKAVDPSDFWKRWHISLSSCLRDYLYIPLGGNRNGQWLMVRNLILTMLIGGLWHGANWTFVIWGGYHGLLLVLYKILSRFWDPFPRIFRQIVFFMLVTLGWVFFRSSDLNMALTLLKRMFSPEMGAMIAHFRLYSGILLIAGFFGLFGPNAYDLISDLKWRKRHFFAIAIGMGICLAIIIGKGDSPFLYFQF